MTIRLFRAPHHTISDIDVTGGGHISRPGKALARDGIRFLDELPEFRRRVLEVLHQPMQKRFL
jgi:magnesium chelatase family protein